MTTRESDLQALHKIHDDWIVYYNTGNVAALLALYDAESVIMPRGRQRISGVEAVRSYFERLFARGRLTMQSKLEKLEINGDWAIRLSVSPMPVARDAGMRDAGAMMVDAGASDAGSDAGGTTPPPAGCACRATGSTSTPLSFLMLSLLGLAIAARRRRA